MIRKKDYLIPFEVMTKEERAEYLREMRENIDKQNLVPGGWYDGLSEQDWQDIIKSDVSNSDIVEAEREQRKWKEWMAEDRYFNGNTQEEWEKTWPETPTKKVFEHGNKIVRNMSDETSKAFWASAEKTAAPVKDWPSWKKGGIEFQQSGIAPATENDRPTSKQQREDAQVLVNKPKTHWINSAGTIVDIGPSEHFGPSPVKSELVVLPPDANVKGWKIHYSLFDRIKHFILGLFQ